MARSFPITPMPKPRMTRSDKWKKRPCVMHYRAFKDECRLYGVEVASEQAVTFVLKMPAGWSEKKKLTFDGLPHTQRPDLDNLLKALWDAVAPEDSHLHSVTASKVWGRTGQIIISNRKLLPCR